VQKNDCVLVEVMMMDSFFSFLYIKDGPKYLLFR